MAPAGMFPTVRAARGDRAAKSLARRLLEPHRRHGCPRAGRRFFSLCRPGQLALPWAPCRRRFKISVTSRSAFIRSLIARDTARAVATVPNSRARRRAGCSRDGICCSDSASPLFGAPSKSKTTGPSLTAPFCLFVLGLPYFSFLLTS